MALFIQSEYKALILLVNIFNNIPCIKRLMSSEPLELWLLAASDYIFQSAQTKY